MGNKFIHLIEDNRNISELMEFILQGQNYQVTTSQTGRDGIKAATETSPHLIILDLGLPDIPGEEVYQLLKSDGQTSKIPIIVVTAHKTEEDIVNCLNMGVDDYITKPFNNNIFLARINAVIKRQEEDSSNGKLSESSPSDRLAFGDLIVDPQSFTAYINDKNIQLTVSEFKILHFLAGHPSWVFSRNQLIDKISGEEHYVNERTIDVQISSLRKKMCHYGQLIVTVRGIGYRFETK